MKDLGGEFSPWLVTRLRSWHHLLKASVPAQVWRPLRLTILTMSWELGSDTALENFFKTPD